MRLKNICRAEKVVTDWGAWETGTKMPKAAFPLSKGNSVRIRGSYRRRIVRFSCLGRDYRLLIFYRLDKQDYDAWLGMVEGSDTRLVARLEYHATHAGWHLHANCETDSTPIGRSGGKAHGLRIKSHRSEFGIHSDEMALYKASKTFGLLRHDQSGNLLNGRQH